MVCRVREERGEAGGIISLAAFTLKHREAVEYDLLTRTGYTLDDIGDALSWGAFSSFVRCLDLDSALGRETRKNEAAWASRIKTNAILADIFDAISQLNANIIALSTGKASKKITPYPRPFDTKKKDSKHYGSGALPSEDLKSWFEKKRIEHNGRKDD